MFGDASKSHRALQKMVRWRQTLPSLRCEIPEVHLARRPLNMWCFFAQECLGMMEKPGEGLIKEQLAKMQALRTESLRA